VKPILPLASLESQIATKPLLAPANRDEAAFTDPHFLFHQGGAIIIDPLNEFFPGSAGGEITSL
jgi:hypothetical protein